MYESMYKYRWNREYFVYFILGEHLSLLGQINAFDFSITPNKVIGRRRLSFAFLPKE